MANHIMFKTAADDAWFYFNTKNILDTLRVVFVSECNGNEDPSQAWRKFSDEAKNNRIKAINVALTDISLDVVQFRDRKACRLQDDIMNVYDLLMAMHEHPEAKLAHLMSRYADGITSLDSDPDLGEHITEGMILKTFAHFITEDILDIEAELYSHASDSADENSPVEDFKAFMKEQYDKHKDKVDEIVNAYNYIANQDAVDDAYNDEIKKIKLYSDNDPVNHPKHKDLVDSIEGARNYFNNDIACTRELYNDPVNHPKHYQASNGLEAIDCIEAFVEDLPGDIGYLIGNAMKYLCRFDKKGKPVEDLQKAKWYIERAIKNIESRKM